MRLLQTTLVFLLILTLPVLAQSSSVPPDSTVVVVPIGGWVAQVAPIIQDALLALVTGLVAWALRSLPAAIRTYVTAGITAQVEQVVNKGIDWAIAAVAGATKDKIWTVDVGNAVVAKAVQYIIEHGPAWLVTWMGGEAMIAQKIIARIGDLLPLNAQVVGGAAATQITANPSVSSNAGETAPSSATAGSPIVPPL